jgi:hypothetical protein
MVSLVPVDQSNWKWRSSGKTNVSGTAKMVTYGYAGSPVGNFKVTVEKTVDEDPVYSTDPTTGEKQINSFESSYTLVDEQYIKAETTTFTVEVSEKGATAKFDVGKAVKIKL